MADIKWVWRDGARLTPWMLYQINRLDAAFFKRWGYRILVSSGVRLEIEQEAIFRARYVTAGNVRGRKVYDTRWWNGQLWYRISNLGTVAAPNSPQANHQIRGTDGAVDLRDTGPDAGIMTKTSPRGRWIREQAAKYDLEPEGDLFGEGWHFKVKNVQKTPPSIPSGGGSKPLPTPIKEEDMGPQRAKSSKTGNWYAIYEFTATLIRAGKSGSENHAHAAAYSKAAGGVNFPTLSSKEITLLKDDAKARATAFFTALGNSAALTKVLAAIDETFADE